MKKGNTFFRPLLFVLFFSKQSLFLVTTPIWIYCTTRLYGTEDVKITNLRCEYLRNPLGIDVHHPRLSWVLESDKRGMKQTAYRILVTGTKENLKKNIGDLWDSGQVESNKSVHIVYQGRELNSGMSCFWKVKVWTLQCGIEENETPVSSDWSESATWEMGLLHSADWSGVWINDGKPVPQREEDFYKEDPVPLFRKEFIVIEQVKRARLYISGLGYYEASINGKKVGDHVLDPGWTSYSRRVLYSTYDVTELLQKGGNCIGVMLGNGWYSPLPMRMWGRLNLREHLTIGRPRLIVQLNVETNDGTSRSICTDESWMKSVGPILRNNVYLGEIYDARKELEDWNSPGFDDNDWSRATVVSDPVGIMKAQMVPPIRITRFIKPVKITEPVQGVYIFDMGQNFTGWIRLRVKGPAGTKVGLRYGELLYPDGTLNVLTSTCGQIKNAAKFPFPESGPPAVAWQSDTYILKGGNEEAFTPRFTFHGFRYVEVTGYPGTPELNVLEGLRLNSDVENVGSFLCSNERFNLIHNMVSWTFLSNLFSVQSDCPHREKFGYGGDIVACDEACMYLFDMAAFYSKVVRDFADDVRPNGGFTETAPYVGIGDSGLGEGAGPVAWGTAHPLLLWHLYLYYGNRQIIEEQYDRLKPWVALLGATAENHILDNGIGDHESLVPKSRALTGTAFYYKNIRLCEFLATAIGRTNDAKGFAELAKKIKIAFNDRFFDQKTGRYDTGTQANQAIALAFHLVPEKYRESALDVLIKDIVENREGHLSTGIFGTKFLLDVLSTQNRGDIAYSIVNQESFPGWGYMLERGATTLWEHWAFSDNTYSHNHPMFGSVSEWFFKHLAGIQLDPTDSGFKKIIIRPEVIGDLTWVKAHYFSIYGRIVSQWRLEGDRLTLDVSIPANTTATVYVVAKDVADVTESGQPISKAAGVSFLYMEKDNLNPRGISRAVFAVGSGNYSFVSRGVKRDF